MLLKTATSLAFATACLTAVAILPAHAQTAYGPAGDPGGNSVGVPGPNPGGPGLTPYSGGARATQPYPSYPTAPGTYGATQPSPTYPPAPTAAGTEVITNGPQGSPPSNWSAQQNVRQSEHYDRLLETSRGFREARMRRECGPITDPELHQQCVASFHQDEPFSGSSSSRRRTRSDMGR